MARGSGFRVSFIEFRVSGSGFRVQGFGVRIQGSGFRVLGSEFGVQGFGFRVRVAKRGAGLKLISRAVHFPQKVNTRQESSF